MNLMLTVHGVGIIICFIMVALVYAAKPSEQQKILFAGTLFTLLDMAGYYFELQSTSIEVTRIAVKLEYMGTTMGLLCFLYFACLYSRHQQSIVIRFIKGFYTIDHIFILCLIFTIDYNTLYYDAITYTVAEDGTYMWHYTPGTFYHWWTTMTTVLGILIALIMIQSVFEHKRNGEKRPELLLIFGASLLPVSFWAVKSTGAFGYYDSYPFSMMLTESFLVFVMYRYKLFDPVKSAKDRVIDEIREGILVTDGSGAVIYSNHEMDVEFPATDWSNQSMVEEKVLRFIESHADGFILGERFFKWQKNEILDDNGRKAGTIYHIADMTDSYLYTKKLIELKEEAERANEAKSSFLAQMSHEIRTPINAVLGMNEMILRETESNTIKEYAFHIQNAGKTLLSIINDILDLSKIESSRMEIMEADYDLCSLLTDVENMITMRAEEKSLTLKVKVNPNLPARLHGDEMRIKQCITNLLTNSVKYTEKGTISLTVDFSEEGPDRISLMVSVADTGSGIKDAELQKLFDPFIRFNMRQNKNVEGTGLGLSITKRLLDMMGGRLSVESVFGQGSTFSFQIPQTAVGSERLGDYKERTKRILDAKQNGKQAFTAPRAQILAVDDNRVNITVAKGLLKRLKVQFDSALSGKECLDKVGGKHYDIILLDHMMPEMDGIETLRNMRQMEAYRQNPPVVIALTANAIVGARDEYLREGFQDYISKPIDPAQLEEKIRQYLPDGLIEYI